MKHQLRFQKSELRSRKHQGYALLLLLVSIVGGGGLLYTAKDSAFFARSVANQQDHYLRNSLKLKEARENLLSYAVSYIDLYGPRGAGVGHFPCPDTDQPSVTDPVYPWRGDSPNPPCGRELVAVGRLPRHVRVKDSQYAFHTNDSQELWYAVSASHINNPVNRVVNPTTAGSMSIDGTDNIIAVIYSPGNSLQTREYEDSSAERLLKILSADFADTPERLSGSRLNDQYSYIRQSDLRRPMMRRVGEWLLLQLESATATRCRGVSHTNCYPYQFVDESCAAILPHGILGSDNIRDSGNVNILHWLSETQPANIENCGFKVPANNAFLLEGVSPARHWFVRNEWLRFVQLHVLAGCSLALADDCRFKLKQYHPDENQLQINLEPVGEESTS